MPKFFRGVVPAWLTRSFPPARRGAGTQPIARAASSAVEALEERTLFAVTTLTNGTGDSTLSVTVDAYGAYGDNGDPGSLMDDAFYDPVGPVGRSGTTFESGVWFSPIDNFLAEGDLSGTGNLPPVAFTSTTTSTAISNFTLGGFVVQLTQIVNPPDNGGTTLTQQYRVTNNSGSTQNVRFVRHVDGDMLFSGTADNDFAGISSDNQFVFEFDTAGTQGQSTGFFGISSTTQSGGNNTGYGIHGFNPTANPPQAGYFDDIDNAKAIPAADINKILGPGLNQNADANSDRLTDTGYDVTISLQTDFTAVPAGGTFIYTTVTRFGQGSPTVIVGPPQLHFGSATYTQSEDGLFASVDVVREGSTLSPLTVDLDIVGGTATAGLDFTDPTNNPGVLTLQFAAGQPSATVQIPLINDSVVEADETVLLQLSNPSAGTLLVAPTDATLTILDATPTVGFPTTLFNFPENVGTASVEITRGGSINAGATVNYQVVANGTATAGLDFTVVSGTVTFAPNQDTATIDVPIIQDFINEPDENFSIVLSSPTGAILGQNASTQVTIVNFEVPPTVLDVDTIGFNNRITQIVVTYSKEMDPARVVLRSNYDLFVRKEKPLAGPVGRPSRINLKKATFEYNDADHTVTITPRNALKFNRFYEIDVSGTRTDAVASAEGAILDGNEDFEEGEDYRNYFGRGDHLFWYDREGDRVELQTVDGSNMDIDRPVLRDTARVELQDVFVGESILTGTWAPSSRKVSPTNNVSTIVLYNSFGVTRQLPPQIIVQTPDLP